MGSTTLAVVGPRGPGGPHHCFGSKMKAMREMMCAWRTRGPSLRKLHIHGRPVRCCRGDGTVRARERGDLWAPSAPPAYLPHAQAPCLPPRTIRGKFGIFFVFAKGLRAQRAGRVAPRRGGAKRRAAALGAAQRRKAPPQAAERRAAHKACFSAFNFAPIIEKQKMLTGRSAGIRPVL